MLEGWRFFRSRQHGSLAFVAPCGWTLVWWSGRPGASARPHWHVYPRGLRLRGDLAGWFTRGLDYEELDGEAVAAALAEEHL